MKAKKTAGEDREMDFPADDEEMVVDFPDDDDAGEEENAFTNAIPWREVDLNTWLRVIETFVVKTINGPATIIQLQKRDGTLVKAWTTKVIATAISAKEKIMKNKKLFIKSIGKTKCKNSNNSYFDFRFKLV